jgi:hypothetical protein
MNPLRDTIYTLIGRGMFTEALQDLQKSEGVSNRIDIWRLRSSVYYEKGDLKTAIDTMSGIIESGDGVIADYYRRGLYIAECDEFEGAITDLKKANELEEIRHPGEQFTSALFWIIIVKLISRYEYDMTLLDRIRDDYDEYIFDQLI